MIAPREVFAAVTRQAIEDHDEWDSPHHFTTLHLDGGRLVPRTVVCIMTDVRPRQYPSLMIGAAGKQHDSNPDDPAAGYLLQIEAYRIAEPPGAPQEVRERSRRAMLAGTAHEHPEAFEVAEAWCADVHGRLWLAMRRRDEPGKLGERFYPPGQAPGMPLVSALLAVAQATGMQYHGLPGPFARGMN